MAEREHIASLDCWCGPIVESYGSELIFNDEGDLVAVKTGDFVDTGDGQSER